MRSTLVVVMMLASAFAATLPMALAVWGVRDDLRLAVPLGGLVQTVVTLASVRLATGRLSIGDLRYP